MSLLKKMVMSAVMKTMDKNKGSNAKNHSSVSDNDADITSDEEVETMESLKRKDMLTRSFSTGNLLDYKSTLRVDQVVSVARAKQGNVAACIEPKEFAGAY